MDIAEKTLQLKKDFDDVYEAGKEEKSREFWEQIQKGGNAQTYYYMFGYNRFNDETFKPIYDIVCSAANNSAQNMFYNTTTVTEINVTIDVRGTTHIGAILYNATKMKTVKKIIIGNKIVSGGNNAFYNCESLENITFEGDISLTINFQYSPLTTKSIVNIVEHLSATASGMSLTISGTAKKNMTFPYTSEESGITYNSWDELIATKTNWTISIP